MDIVSRSVPTLRALNLCRGYPPGGEFEADSSWRGLTDLGLRSLHKLQLLRVLLLRHQCGVGSAGVGLLVENTNLTQLDLTGLYALTPTCIPVLKRLSALTALSLHGCHNLGREVQTELLSHANLTHVDFPWTEPEDLRTSLP